MPVRIGHEHRSARTAMMPGSSALDHFPPHPARSHDEIVSTFLARLHRPWGLLGVQFQVRSAANRACRVHDGIVSVDWEPLIRPPSSPSRSPSLQNRARANVDMLSLIVEVGAPADELEVREDELVQTPSARSLGTIDILDEGYFRSACLGA